MTNIHSYPKIYSLGHPAIATLFDTPVVVQEKYDGSQLSWMWDETGQLHVKSKGSIQYGPERLEPDKMFKGAIDYLLSLPVYPVHKGIVCRGEWFGKPKHNTIAYDRIPKNGLMLFDVEDQPNDFMGQVSVRDWANYLGIEAAHSFDWDNAVDGLDTLVNLLDTESTLGGHKIEGVVIKAYGQFTRDAKVMMGKYVSEAFKEKHKREWKKGNPGRKDVVQELISSLDTEARYHKAIQHLRDDGLLTDSPKDIGPLMKELKRDTQDEEKEWVAEKLVAHFMPQIMRGVGRGFPQFYKDLLMERQFDE